MWCPTPDCDTVVNTAGVDDFVSCLTCLRLLCVKCGNFAHVDGDCIFNNLDYAALHIKKCPTCFTPIERIDGCNEMHCLRCDNIFCYRCGLDITNNPHEHFRTICDQYNDRPAVNFGEIDGFDWERHLRNHPRGRGSSFDQDYDDDHYYGDSFDDPNERRVLPLHNTDLSYLSFAN